MNIDFFQKNLTRKGKKKKQKGRGRGRPRKKGNDIPDAEKIQSAYTFLTEYQSDNPLRYNEAQRKKLLSSWNQKNSFSEGARSEIRNKIRDMAQKTIATLEIQLR